MKYFVIRIEWSQTDTEYKVVQASSKEKAINHFKYPNGPRYVTCYGETDKIVVVNQQVSWGLPSLPIPV